MPVSAKKPFRKPGVRLASFNSETVGKGIPGAEGIVDRVRYLETGLSRISGLFGSSSDEVFDQVKQMDKAGKLVPRRAIPVSRALLAVCLIRPRKSNEPERPDLRSTRRDLSSVRSRKEKPQKSSTSRAFVLSLALLHLCSAPRTQLAASGSNRLLPTWGSAQVIIRHCRKSRISRFSSCDSTLLHLGQQASL